MILVDDEGDEGGRGGGVRIRMMPVHCSDLEQTASCSGGGGIWGADPGDDSDAGAGASDDDCCCLLLHRTDLLVRFAWLGRRIGDGIESVPLIPFFCGRWRRGAERSGI